MSLCSFVLPVTLADTDRARDLVLEGMKASVRDAVHAAVMLNNDLEAVASFDRGFEHIPGIERVQLD